MVDPLFPLKGKTALITGSTGGVGLSIAEGLAKAGCGVVLHGLLHESEAQAVVQNVRDTYGTPAEYIRADLSDGAAVEHLITTVLEKFGAVDILVNNAVTRHFSAVEDFPVECWDKALAVNLSSAFLLVRGFLPAMRRAKWGRIFNMTSIYGERGVANRIDYVTTKTALIGMTRALSVETLGSGVTCNSISPGAVLSPASDGRIRASMAADHLSREAATSRFLQGKQPTGQFVEGTHVADTVVFLCGAAGRDITGSTLHIDGGWSAS